MKKIICITVIALLSFCSVIFSLDETEEYNYVQFTTKILLAPFDCIESEESDFSQEKKMNWYIPSVLTVKQFLDHLKNTYHVGNITLVDFRCNGQSKKRLIFKVMLTWHYL